MQRVTKSTPSSSLAEVVCAWPPTKLPQLAKKFADSCSPPKVTFSSYDSYRAYFEPLLLAEVAADLHSTSEKFRRSPPARQTKVRARREEPGTTVALVVVGKVNRQHPWGFGWEVDIDSHDRKGPVGCIDNDVVTLWPSEQPQTHSNKNKARSTPHPVPRVIPDNAVHAVVVRTPTRTGCRLVLSKFPDGNEHGLRTDLEDGEENEDTPPVVRVWNLLRIGSLTTMKREFDAVLNIKTSVLLPLLLRPNQQSGSGLGHEKEAVMSAPKTATGEHKSSSQQEQALSKFRNEQQFTDVIVSKTGLNPSQTRAILHASTCRNGFSVIQGPPGTGKTRTLISLLNVIHMTQYQEYYENLLASFAPVHGINAQPQRDAKQEANSTESRNEGPDKAAEKGSEKGSEGGFLSSMLLAMNRTFSIVSEQTKLASMPKRARRPRLLVCAPSNSAVDEILTRVTSSKFIDGQGRGYCPELARIGAGDRVSEAAKTFTAEGQAEAFLDRLCAEDMTPEAQKKAQMSFLATWQNRCNALLVQLARTPKRQPAFHPTIIDLHEKLERMDRDLRRLSIAASDGAKALNREEKLRQIARTYVEDAQLVFSTLSGAASSVLTKKGVNDMTAGDGPLFDTVVIDEGAQATEPSCLIPMALGASRCLLVGDPQQLPATVLSSGAAGLAYGQSLLERVCKGGQTVQLLDTQYRMHPAISSFPRRYFYHGRLVDDESVQGENRARPYHRDEIRPRLGPYVFLDIADGEERRGRDDRSVFNRSEAELASLIYTKLKKEYPKDSLFAPAAKVPGSVTGFGVVTPYKRQMQELRQSFDRAGIPTGDVEIDTVDSFQGREKDVIVFSCVRTASPNRGIGFVRDVRRMNVGLTRARSSLIILGSAHALAEGSPDWAELVEDASSRGCLISVSDVGRCLLPPIPEPSPVLASGIRDGPAGGEETATVVARQSVPVGERPPSTEASAHPTGPIDPRRKTPKKALHIDSGSGLGDEVIAHSGAAPSITPGNDVSITTLLQASGQKRYNQASQAPNLNVVDGLSEKNADLQSTLDQVTKVLADAGVQNLGRFKETLRDYVKSGGALEIEAVMAAALTNEGSNSEPLAAPHSTFPAKWPQSDTETPHQVTKPDRELADVDGTDRQRTAEGAAAATDDTLDTRKVESKLQDSVPRASKSAPADKTGFSERSARVVRGEGGRRLTKANGRDKEHDRSRKKTERAAPSGWDMLFSKSSEPPSAKASDVETKVATASSSTQKDDTKEVQRGSPEKTPSTKAAKKADQSEETEVKQEPLSEQSKSKEQSGITSKVRKNRNENGREIERKRPRTGEYGAFGSGRGGYRGGRGRGRPKRGRERGNYQYDQRGQETYAGDDSWAPTQYEPGFLPFQVPGNMDPGLGSTHGIDAMQIMQQQQVMQHALQQQALHQHALQQQMQQQQMHQEAMMHQANLMQMPGNIHIAPVPPQAYQIGFDGYANNGNQQGQERGHRGESRNYGGRGHRGGRGRGRGKYGNRNR